MEHDAQPPVRLVGRRTERAALLERIEQAADGRGGTLVICGDPGMGKSRLLDHARCCAEDFTVLRAAGTPSEAPIAWSGLFSLLRRHHDQLDALPEALAAPLRAALHLGPPQPIEPLAIGAALLQVVTRLAEAAPVLLVVDDLHWLDEASCAAVLFCLRRIDADRVAALLALHPHSPIDVGDLPTITLGGLDDAEAAELLEVFRLEPSARRELNRICAGNPLALLEYGRQLDPAQRTGLVPIGELGTVTSAGRPYQARVAALDEATRFALLLLCLHDGEDRELVDRAVAGAGFGPAQWELAERHRLVQRGPGTARVAHPLVGAAVTAAADAVLVRRAHRALAAVTDGERSVWHRATSSVERDETIAADLELLAGDAFARGDARRAERAASLAGQLSEDPAGAARRFMVAARAATAAGHDPGAHLAAASAVGDAAVRAEAAVLTAAVASWTGDEATLRRLIEVDVPARRGDDPITAALVCSFAAVGAWNALDPGRAAELADESWALVGGQIVAGHPMGVTPAMALVVYGDLVDGRAPAELVDRCLAHLDEHGLVELVLPLSLSLLIRGRHDEALELTTRAASRAAARGAVTATVWLSVGAAMAANRLGRLDVAVRWATQAHQLAASAALPFARAQAAAELALIAAQRGDRDELVGRVAEVRAIGRQLAIGPSQEVAAYAEALGEFLDGDPLSAVSLFAARPVLPPGTLEFFPVTYDLIEALVRTDRLEAAEALRPRLGLVAAHGSLAHHGQLARTEGLLARGEAAVVHFEAAIACFDAGHRRLEAARTRLLLGERLRRLGRRVAAREALDAALAVFETQGCRPWVTRCRSELQACGVRAPGAPLDPEREPLTAQEEQIAAAVAAGQSNREAAAALFVSTKTVETHLTRIYRKLGVRTRTELATLIARSSTAEAALS